jgi:hypothetical protein
LCWSRILAAFEYRTRDFIDIPQHEESEAEPTVCNKSGVPRLIMLNSIDHAEFESATA